MEGKKLIRFSAEMTCEGCSGAITRILQKVAGVSDINCSIPDQLVTLTADESIDPTSLLERLQVWGEAASKRVEFLAN